VLIKKIMRGGNFIAVILITEKFDGTHFPAINHPVDGSAQAICRDCH